MKAKLSRANTIHDMDTDTKESKEIVLSEYLEMLRLCSGDDLGLGFRVPFLLMGLGADHDDDDAFDFCCHWLQIAAGGGNQEEMWIYLRHDQVTGSTLVSARTTRTVVVTVAFWMSFKPFLLWNLNICDSCLSACWVALLFIKLRIHISHQERKR